MTDRAQCPTCGNVACTNFGKCLPAPINVLNQMEREANNHVYLGFMRMSNKELLRATEALPYFRGRHPTIMLEYAAMELRKRLAEALGVQI